MIVNRIFIKNKLQHFQIEMPVLLSRLRSQAKYTFNQLIVAPNGATVVVPAGIEPTTHRLEICCSIHLSYGTNMTIGRGRQIRTADLHVPNVAR